MSRLTQLVGSPAFPECLLGKLISQSLVTTPPQLVVEGLCVPQPGVAFELRIYDS